MKDDKSLRRIIWASFERGAIMANEITKSSGPTVEVDLYELILVLAEHALICGYAMGIYDEDVLQPPRSSNDGDKDDKGDKDSNTATSQGNSHD